MTTIEMIKNLAQRNSVVASADVLAVFEALDAKDKRVAVLEAKLATPVRLPDVLFIKVSGSAVPVMHADRVKERVHAAGFTVEGDE